MERRTQPGYEYHSCDFMDDGWIPVEERLPVEGEEVLITTDVGLIATGYIHCFEWITGVEPDYPIAWRPLPDPYRPGRSRENEDEKE